MAYCVLIKISKRIVSFWYQTDHHPYAPLVIKETNEVPLYFYVSGNDFVFGHAARDRFYQHDPNAYGDYFEIIKDPGCHFTIYGNKKPVKQLFYYGIEQYLSFFINTVLYKGDSIESYRQHFPLKFLFEADVEDKEKALIESLLTDAGYFNISRVDYDAALFEVLIQTGFLAGPGQVLLLNALNDTLYLKLYDNLSAAPVKALKIDGQGADPRVRILAEMIIEYIVAQNSFLSLDKEKEIAMLLSFCAGLLHNLNPVIQGDAELTDGNKYWYRINERSLNDRLQFYAKDLGIYAAIDDLLQADRLNPEGVTIILVGEEISTSYFSNKLLKKYPRVKCVHPGQLKETMNLVFNKVRHQVLQPPKIVPAAPPLLTKPVMPGKIAPPPLPKKKENAVQVSKPPLPPVIKSTSPIKTAPILPPPLPKKKNN
jgi:hypothetical protein